MSRSDRFSRAGCSWPGQPRQRLSRVSSQRAGPQPEADGCRRPGTRAAESTDLWLSNSPVRRRLTVPPSECSRTRRFDAPPHRARLAYIRSASRFSAPLERSPRSGSDPPMWRRSHASRAVTKGLPRCRVRDPEPLRPRAPTSTALAMTGRHRSDRTGIHGRRREGRINRTPGSTRPSGPRRVLGRDAGWPPGTTSWETRSRPRRRCR